MTVLSFWVDFSYDAIHFFHDDMLLGEMGMTQMMPPKQIKDTSQLN
jgi:hypothetical protein